MTELINGINHVPQVHILYNGVSNNIDMTSLDVGDLSTDTQIREAIASYLEVPNSKMANYQVDRSPSGDVTLRPQASFGTG